MTPKSYLSFIDGYKNIYGEKRAQIGELAERMNTGLDKLVEASASVALLSEELVVKEKELAVASIKADKVTKGLYAVMSIVLSFRIDRFLCVVWRSQCCRCGGESASHSELNTVAMTARCQSE